MRGNEWESGEAQISKCRNSVLFVSEGHINLFNEMQTLKRLENGRTVEMFKENLEILKIENLKDFLFEMHLISIEINKLLKRKNRGNIPL